MRHIYMVEFLRNHMYNKRTSTSDFLRNHMYIKCAIDAKARVTSRITVVVRSRIKNSSQLISNWPQFIQVFAQCSVNYVIGIIGSAIGILLKIFKKHHWQH